MTENEALIWFIKNGGCLNVYPEYLPITFWWQGNRFFSTSGDRRVCFIECIQQAKEFREGIQAKLDQASASIKID